MDASQLERNLLLTLQLLEYGKPTVLGLNMIDVAKARGIVVDHEILQERLGITVLPLIARTGKGSGQVLSVLEKRTTIPRSTSNLIMVNWLKRPFLRLSRNYSIPRVYQTAAGSRSS